MKRVSECNDIVTCHQDESCYQDKVPGNEGHLYNLGCRQKQECKTIPQSIVGRHFLFNNGTIPDNCTACCDEETCNRGLCWNDNGCMDRLEVDCSAYNFLFDVCRAINKAKLTCRRFCGLCDVVDGAFSDWTDWNNCDVTCGNGTQTRSRTCTKPAPEHGGADCVGNHNQTKSCEHPACPVHGGWSKWSPWGTCSVSCGPGLQRRGRNCSNPYPDQHGDHCYGESRDDRICTPKACADGGWSSWNMWNSCSVSCGNGFKTRSRECANPEPSVYGKPCRGQPNEIMSCNNNRCPDDRKTPIIVYKAKDATVSKLSNGDTIVFPTAVINNGGGYNYNTGVFTAPVNGLYMFSVQICLQIKTNIFIRIIAADTVIAAARFEYSINAVCSTTHGFDVLSQGDTVKVVIVGKSSGSVIFPDLKRNYYWTSFSGVLIHK